LHYDSKPDIENIVLQQFTYFEDFESGTLGAWASYPLWQDTAYDPNFRVGTIVPGDSNISIVQKVTPYTNVDTYAGAQKLLDMYFAPDSSITLRYYLKSHLPFDYFRVRLAAGNDGKVDYTVNNPPLNRWEWITVTFEDLIRENPHLADRDRIKVNALAIVAKLPDADPAMPFYLGLDDIEFRGARAVPFSFIEPEMYKLSEWKLYISRKHYYKGDSFNLHGMWLLDANRVTLTITSFTDRTKIFLNTELEKRDKNWTLKPLTFNYPEGLYIGKLSAFKDRKMLSETLFTIHIASCNTGKKHPRLWFDSKTRKDLKDRLNMDRFKDVFNQLSLEAARQREKVPVESLVSDMDQFPDENWLPSWEAWGSRFYDTAESLYVNSLTYVFHGYKAAGEYAKNILIKLAAFDNWTHPWQTKRGRFTEHRSGWWAHRLALAYDITYGLMTEKERKLIRKAFINNIVKTTHQMYIVDNDVTGNTSNWIAHTAGASLMMQAAMFGDGPEVETLEPYFTGAAMKLYAYIRNISDPDGAFCEGLGYNNYSFHTLCQSLPAIENVFNLDMSKPLDGTYKEYIWAGPVNDKYYFFFGDTEGHLNPITNWAWLLSKYSDPLLAWFYNFLKQSNIESNTRASMTGYMNLINEKNETFMDVLYETDDFPKTDPFKENPVKCFKKVGTTVFKSGWDPDDFIFVMRTGSFFNHQHLDQGSFWLADHGSIFIEERSGSSYYDDPLYQSRYIQPVGHSTILIDFNHQSQRVGDHLEFAEGFHDHAFVSHFLDGKYASFISGDIGRLYWGKVNSLQRNVLYLKPRTLIMLDTVVPAEHDVDVTLLYQTRCLKDIHADKKMSTITKDGVVLYIKHLHQGHLKVTSVETPHYLYTLREEKPLVREGMLTVTARTSGNPLVIANILTTSKDIEPDISIDDGHGFMRGSVNGIPYIFNTEPGKRYNSGEFITDAQAVTWNDSTTHRANASSQQVVAALCTYLVRSERLLIQSENPITCEITLRELKYYLAVESKVAIALSTKPQLVTVNGNRENSFVYDAKQQTVTLTLPCGEGIVTF